MTNPTATTSATAQRSDPLALGVSAARANLIPAVILWFVAAGVLVAWFVVPITHDWLVHLGELKTQFGYFYSMVGMATFAGIIPFFMQRLATDKSNQRTDLTMLAFLTVFWAIKGIEVDALYRLQSYLWGNGHDPLTIIEKIFIDEFVYCPLWAVPSMTFAMAWVQRGLTKNPWPANHSLPRWYVRHVFPVLISNWCIWVPAVAVVYALPLALQLPIQNLVVCLYVLLVLVMTRHTPTPPTTVT